MSSDFQASGRLATAIAPLWRQGMMVRYYVDPAHAVGNELRGTVTAMILNYDRYFEGKSNAVLVCPRIEDHGRATLRPDLTTSIGLKFLSPVPGTNGQPVIMPQSTVQAVKAKLLDIVAPQDKAVQATRFLAQGEFRFFRSIPFAQDHTDSADAGLLCLSPAKMVQQTGMALVTRSYSNWNVFSFRLNTFAGTANYKPAYFKSSILAVSIDRPRCGAWTGHVSRKVWAEWLDKFAGTIDEAAYERNKAVYTLEKGELPEDARRALVDYERQQLQRQKQGSHAFRL